MDEKKTRESSNVRESSLGGRWKRGVIAGVAATVAMSVLMVIGMITGVAPMPKPIPIAIVATMLGTGLPQTALMTLAIVAHLGYGGFWGGLLSIWAAHPRLLHGFLLGVFLWIVMQIVVLPFLGWGLFGSAITLRIAGATLLLHLIYGGTLGWLLGRHDRTN